MRLPAFPRQHSRGKPKIRRIAQQGIAPFDLGNFIEHF
jgi:hypothetical protein